MTETIEPSETIEPTETIEPPERPRQTKVARYAALAVGVVLVLFIALLATRGPEEGGTGPNSLIGRRVPALAGQTLDGGRVDVDTYRGKWLVVNFLASWCVGCIEEHPDLLAFQAEHEAAGDAAIVGVAFNDNLDDLRAFFVRNGGNWPVIVSDDGRAAIDFGVTAVPESFVVDPNGRVVAHNEGVTKAWLDSIIEQFSAPAPSSAPDGATGGVTDGP